MYPDYAPQPLDVIRTLQGQVESLQSELALKNFELDTLKNALNMMLEKSQRRAITTRVPQGLRKRLQDMGLRVCVCVYVVLHTM